MTWSNPPALAVFLIMLCGLAACGRGGQDALGSPAPSDDGKGIAGMCTQEEPDCVDTPQLHDDEPAVPDETAIAQFRRDARFYLGKRQDQLNELVRVARIDDEYMPVTDDYRIGRLTVELDDLHGDGNPVVTSVTVELPDGPETFELDQ